MAVYAGNALCWLKERALPALLVLHNNFLPYTSNSTSAVHTSAAQVQVNNKHTQTEQKSEMSANISQTSLANYTHITVI